MVHEEGDRGTRRQPQEIQMTYLMHPDDEPSPRFGGWADDFNTYREACAYYGAEDPESLAAEDRYYRELADVEEQDRLEAQGPTFRRFPSAPLPVEKADWSF